MGGTKHGIRIQWAIIQLWGGVKCWHTLHEAWKHYAEPDTKGQKFLRFHLLHLREISRIVRFTETARRLEVTTGWERWGINYCLTGTELLFGVIQNFGNSGDGYPTLHTWCCWTVHFKMVIKGKFYSVYILPQSKMVLKKERWENKENCFDNCIP